MFRIPLAGAVPNFRDSAEALHVATREMRKSGLGWIVGSSSCMLVFDGGEQSNNTSI